MNFGEAVTSAYKNIFNYSGRSARSEFWWFQLFLVPFSLPYLFDGIYLFLLGLPGPSLQLYSIFWLVNMLANVALMVRRVHDQDSSGFWVLLVIVPVIGPLYILYLMMLSGTDGPNRFGPSVLDGRFDELELPSDVIGVERLEHLVNNMLDDAAVEQFCDAYDKQGFQDCWNCLAAAGVKNEDVYDFIAAMRDDGYVPQLLLDRRSASQ